MEIVADLGCCYLGHSEICARCDYWNTQEVKENLLDTLSAPSGVLGRRSTVARSPETLVVFDLSLVNADAAGWLLLPFDLLTEMNVIFVSRFPLRSPGLPFATLGKLMERANEEAVQQFGHTIGFFMPCLLWVQRRRRCRYLASLFFVEPASPHGASGRSTRPAGIHCRLRPISPARLFGFSGVRGCVHLAVPQSHSKSLGLMRGQVRSRKGQSHTIARVASTVPAMIIVEAGQKRDSPLDLLHVRPQSTNPVRRLRTK